jgi:hypothetical protein
VIPKLRASKLEGRAIAMSLEVIRELPDRFCYITLTFKEDQAAGSLLAHKAIREAGTTWLALLGPVQPLLFLQSALDNIIGGVRLDREVVAQLALRHIAEMTAFDLMLAVQIKHEGLPLHACLDLPERLLALYRHKQACERAAFSANGIKLSRAQGILDPEAREWARRSDFVTAVMERRNDLG